MQATGNGTRLGLYVSARWGLVPEHSAPSADARSATPGPPNGRPRRPRPGVALSLVSTELPRLMRKAYEPGAAPSLFLIRF